VTGKGVLVQGVLAALGLVAVYTTWQREPDRAPGEVTVLNLGKKDLTSLHYEDDQTSVEVYQRGETADGEPDVWVKIAEKPKAAASPTGSKTSSSTSDKVSSEKPPGDKATTDKAATEKPSGPAEKPAPPPREFRGSEAARRLWNDFAPFRSPRAFGALDTTKAKELGVDDASAKKKLTVTSKAGTFSFVLGQPPAHGSGETYLRDLNDGRIFLASRLIVGDFQGASHRLVDRRLNDLKLGDFDQITVTAGGKTRKVVVLNRREPNSLRFAPASAPEKPDDMLKTWHEKVWRLTPADVLGKGETPSEGEPKVDVRVEYFDRGRSLGWVELAHVDKSDVASSSAAKTGATAQNTVLFARSAHTAGWLKLAFDPVLLTDSEKVAAGS